MFKVGFKRDLGYSAARQEEPKKPVISEPLTLSSFMDCTEFQPSQPGSDAKVREFKNVSFLSDDQIFTDGTTEFEDVNLLSSDEENIETEMADFVSIKDSSIPPADQFCYLNEGSPKAVTEQLPLPFFVKDVVDKLSSCLKTMQARLKAPIALPEHLEKRDDCAVISRPGAFLSASAVMSYLRAIAPADRVCCVFDYLTPTNLLSLNDVKKCFDTTFRGLKNPSDPIVMPLVFSGRINHVTVVVIKDGVIAFYDSKAVPAKDYQFNGGGDMEKALFYLNEILFDGKGAVIENPYKTQYNVHDCGVFISRFVYEKLVESKNMREFSPYCPTPEVLIQYREEMLKAISEI